MKYCILIIDGVAGLPLPEHGNKTCLELALTPNLDAMAAEAVLGLVRTVPPGMEPSTACACIAVLGYDPEVHYQGRAAIEAKSMGIAVNKGEAVFRCNLVAIRDGKMWDYSAGHISTDEARELIQTLNEELGDDRVRFYPGINYRHICKLKRGQAVLQATCTPPHDIPDKLVTEFLPRGQGSDVLRELMEDSKAVLQGHPVNVKRRSNGEVPAEMIWLFWGSVQATEMPSFKKVYGLNAAVTSAVDVLQGLARMMGMEVLDIPGVKDGMDNNFAAQARGALVALRKYDLTVIHVEATDEAAHIGSIDNKVEAIQRVDSEIVNQIRGRQGSDLRVLVLPDHPTPIKTRTHSGEPVPFMMWGSGLTPNGARRFTENEATNTGVFIDEGYRIMSRLLGLDS